MARATRSHPSPGGAGLFPGPLGKSVRGWSYCGCRESDPAAVGPRVRGACQSTAHRPLPDAPARDPQLHAGGRSQRGRLRCGQPWSSRPKRPGLWRQCRRIGTRRRVVAPRLRWPDHAHPLPLSAPRGLPDAGPAFGPLLLCRAPPPTTRRARRSGPATRRAVRLRRAGVVTCRSCWRSRRPCCRSRSARFEHLDPAGVDAERAPVPQDRSRGDGRSGQQWWGEPVRPDEGPVRQPGSMDSRP